MPLRCCKKLRALALPGENGPHGTTHHRQARTRLHGSAVREGRLDLHPRIDGLQEHGRGRQARQYSELAGHKDRMAFQIGRDDGLGGEVPRTNVFLQGQFHQATAGNDFGISEHHSSL